ncbi:hypothetical protein GRJ2_002177600 [Grus japonensis]|uniref:Uncharacterized protein n=1 Tax=Grus japonensis TaxID=30415 RepID=A0ABC9XHG0_GRUJA
MNKTGSRKARIQYAEDSPMDPKSKTLLSELRETAQLQQAPLGNIHLAIMKTKGLEQKNSFWQIISKE